MTDVMTAAWDDAKPTPLLFEEAEAAMRWALSQQMGHNPSDDVVALALSKTALETYRWQSMWNSNWGNLKASPSYVGMYTAYACNEVLNNQVVWFSPAGRLDKKDGKVVAEAWSAPPWHPQTRFRAYANAFDGADQYVTLIATGRYKVAWTKLLSADFTGFVHELKLAGYFTADESLYAKGVSYLYQEYRLRVEGIPHDIAHAISGVDIDHDAILATIRGDQFAHVNYAQSGTDVGEYATT